HRLASGTKSFSGAMLAAAVEDGLLKLDEKVADTITEWKNDQRKSQITIRHLLSLTSGIFGGSTREFSPSYARAVIIAGAKFGLLIEHQGNWQGQQIIPAKVLQECFVGTGANPRYGLTFWLKGGGRVPDDLVMAHGQGSQILYIIPSIKLVVVQFAETEQF